MDKKFINAKKYLEEQDFTNICTVKKLDTNTGDLLITHLLFNSWVGTDILTFKLMPTTEDDIFQIIFKDILVYSKVNILDVRKKMNSLNIKIHKDYAGNVMDIQIIKGKRKKK